MKFDTSSGPVGSNALLESRILYPKREEQCLQFFYKMTGAAGDQLVISVRTDDGTGTTSSTKNITTIIGNSLNYLSIDQSTNLSIYLTFAIFFNR